MGEDAGLTCSLHQTKHFPDGTDTRVWLLNQQNPNAPKINS